MTRKSKAKTRPLRSDKPLLKTIEGLKKLITKTAEGGVKFDRFVAMYLSVTPAGARFTVQAVDARNYREALFEAVNNKPIRDAKVFVLTAAQAEFMKNRLEEAASRRAPDIVVRDTGVGLRRGR